MKAKLKGAETGHSLLKRKSEALTKFVVPLPVYVYQLTYTKLDVNTFCSTDVSEVHSHLRIPQTPPNDRHLTRLPLLTEITRRIDEAKRKMGRVMQIASLSLAEVTYAVGGNIGYQIQESAKSARFRIRAKQENVSGVLLPAFEAYQTEGNNDFAMTGLGKGGQQVQRCRETYARAVEALVELASLQTAFVILDEVIKVVNRRVNAM